MRYGRREWFRRSALGACKAPEWLNHPLRVQSLFHGEIDPTRAGSADLHGFLYPPRSILEIESYKDADTRNRMADCAMPHNLETSSRIHKILIEDGDVRSEWAMLMDEWVEVIEACALHTHLVQAAGAG